MNSGLEPNMDMLAGGDPQNVPPQSFVMPEGWEPGQPILIPDPRDPTGKTMIEIPADQLEVMVEVPQLEEQPDVPV